MDMTFDSKTWAELSGDSGLGRRLFPARLDWSELAARLAAAHAFQRHGGVEAELRGGDGAFMFPPASGSFHEPTARVLAGFNTESAVGPPGWSETAANRLTGNAALGREEGKVSQTVNPTSSADRKNTSGKDMTVAGLFPSGNRGLK
ncbi:hypothetical protein [Novosphingobium rosa]|uniref:hypothetical protein n=1 Tax=Novosphingobium rosa TaxID=76978 RepID=UPI0008374C49|nr:hypothetical protein [Novosphingobium rosa]